MIHIYTGCGKGKTTAAVGLAVRAAGAGLRVYFLQMMKDGSSSEIAMLQKLGIETYGCPNGGKFVSRMTDEEKRLLAGDLSDILSKAKALLSEGKADLLVIDEFFCALSSGLLGSKSAEELILGYKGSAEIVLTGRNACKPYTDSADYITELKELEHPYKKGVSARKGIEF